MKIQDVLFFVIFAILIWKNNPVAAVWVGIVSLVLSIPLFSFWIFFTAERFTWYAGAFFLLAIILYLFNHKHEK
jgi:hypothetical protein